VVEDFPPPKQVIFPFACQKWNSDKREKMQSKVETALKLPVFGGTSSAAVSSPQLERIFVHLVPIQIKFWVNFAIFFVCSFFFFFFFLFILVLI
jgi:hypothetical protein